MTTTTDTASKTLTQIYAEQLIAGFTYVAEDERKKAERERAAVDTRLGSPYGQTVADAASYVVALGRRVSVAAIAEQLAELLRKHLGCDELADALVRVREHFDSVARNAVSSVGEGRILDPMSSGWHHETIAAAALLDRFRAHESGAFDRTVAAVIDGEPKETLDSLIRQRQDAQQSYERARSQTGRQGHAENVTRLDGLIGHAQVRAREARLTAEAMVYRQVARVLP